MNSFKTSPYFFPILLLLIFVLNVVQSSTTQLIVDEAYYWTYSQELAFGYFDHPPLIALYIWISDILFNGELGVRFVSSIGYILMMLILWKTIEHPQKKQYNWLFILLFFSTALLNVYGFITVPDTPLLLFIALFLRAYKLYLDNKSTMSYILLTIAMTGMLYSKYHGVLVIFFTLLSNYKVLKDPKMLLSGLGVLILFFPHLYWQYVNDFPSIRYHLYERASVAGYKFEDTLLHFVNAIAIVGLTFVVLYKAFFKGIRSKSIFHKGLNYIIIGFFVFFLLSSFRGHVQAQWLAPIIFPLLYIAFNYLLGHTKEIKLFKYLAFANIIIILLARIVIANEGMVSAPLPFYGNEQWALKVKEHTTNTNKLFVNGYQKASTYWFYAQERPHYQHSYLGRKNQYGLVKGNLNFTTDSIAQITGKRDQYSVYGFKGSERDSIFVSFIEHLKPYFQLSMSMGDQKEVIFQNSDIDTYQVQIKNPYDFVIDFNDIDIFIVFQNKIGDEKYSIPANIDAESIKAQQELTALLSFDTSLMENIQEFPTVGIGIRTDKKMELVKVSPLYNYKIHR